MTCVVLVDLVDVVFGKDGLVDHAQKPDPFLVTVNLPERP